LNTLQNQALKLYNHALQFTGAFTFAGALVKALKGLDFPVTNFNTCAYSTDAF